MSHTIKRLYYTKIAVRNCAYYSLSLIHIYHQNGDRTHLDSITGHCDNGCRRSCNRIDLDRDAALVILKHGIDPVSYTHLAVYKRQVQELLRAVRHIRRVSMTGHQPCQVLEHLQTEKVEVGIVLIVLPYALFQLAQVFVNVTAELDTVQRCV